MESQALEDLNLKLQEASVFKGSHLLVRTSFFLNGVIHNGYFDD
jgi:hypothetical protein